MSGNIPPVYVGNANLLLLAEVLETADEEHAARGEPPYSQYVWSHSCGTPACAIGHWNYHKGRRQEIGNTDLCSREFAMNVKTDDWAHLFGYKPGFPKTAKESAERIRAYVARRSAADTRDEHG